jgi:hypothetical protein
MGWEIGEESVESDVWREWSSIGRIPARETLLHLDHTRERERLILQCPLNPRGMIERRRRWWSKQCSSRRFRYVGIRPRRVARWAMSSNERSITWVPPISRLRRMVSRLRVDTSQVAPARFRVIKRVAAFSSAVLALSFHIFGQRFSTHGHQRSLYLKNCKLYF